MKNIIIVILVLTILCTGGVVFLQQKDYSRERTALVTINSALTAELSANQKLLKEKEKSERELNAIQEETKNALLLKTNENEDLRKSISPIYAKLCEEENKRGKLLYELNDLESRLQVAQKQLNSVRESEAKLRARAIQLEKDYFYFKYRTENKEEVIKILESYAFGDAEVKNPVVSVKPVLFIPKDYDAPKLKKDQENIKAGLRIIQSWFLKRVGATFNFSDPIVFEGKKTITEYETNHEGYSQSQQAALLRAEIAQEISVPVKGYYLVFLYGKTSGDWAQFFDIAIVGNVVIDSLRRNQSYDTQRYTGMGIISHELGHLFGGLADIAMDSGTIMSFPDAFSFPNADFTETEKQTLRRHMN